MKLAIAQIVLGVLIALFSGFSMVWGFPTTFTVPIPESVSEGAEHFVKVFTTPGPLQIFAQASAFFALVLGLAVLGCGTAQLLKSRR